MKQLWLLVGGNGAGKTTFYRTQLKPLGMPFVNADDIARDVFPQSPEAHSYEAAKIAENLRNSLLEQGKNFCFETVFSHPSKIDFVAKAKALGYQVVMVFIHLEQSSLNKARVHQRIETGGHAVPEDKIETRIPRTIDNVLNALPLCDDVWVLDNSSAQAPYQKVLRIHDGKLQQFIQPLPAWARRFTPQ
ncbi:MAG: AAA family ATPase [Burkholderiales bacterium]|jgi:predicted ABC-type ATPase|uniref:AAA family ATPase n=1 Tax=Limnobacter sp. TaxID=2003368 RepID=UPI0039BCEAD9|nr:AAA family ATPase [Burkholderiales bacterium]